MFMYLEDLLFIDAVYFAVVTASTVGYGDIYPQVRQGSLHILQSVLQRTARALVQKCM